MCLNKLVYFIFHLNFAIGLGLLKMCIYCMDYFHQSFQKFQVVLITFLLSLNKSQILFKN